MPAFLFHNLWQWPVKSQHLGRHVHLVFCTATNTSISKEAQKADFTCRAEHGGCRRKQEWKNILLEQDAAAGMNAGGPLLTYPLFNHGAGVQLGALCRLGKYIYCVSVIAFLEWPSVCARMCVNGVWRWKEKESKNVRKKWKNSQRVETKENKFCFCINDCVLYVTVYMQKKNIYISKTRVYFFLFDDMSSIYSSSISFSSFYALSSSFS